MKDPLFYPRACSSWRYDDSKFEKNRFSLEGKKHSEFSNSKIFSFEGAVSNGAVRDSAAKTVPSSIVVIYQNHV
jgi:hypothetical protein